MAFGHAFNILSSTILQTRPKSPKWSLSLTLADKILCTVFFSLSRATCPVHLIFRVAVTVTEFRENLNILVTSHVGENLRMNSTVQYINHLKPNGHFSGRTAPLTYRCRIFLFIQQIYLLNILNMLHTLHFFLFKMSFIS
jgi:hypothetical protein